jgi:hypothetical protein
MTKSWLIIPALLALSGCAVTPRGAGTSAPASSQTNSTAQTPSQAKPLSAVAQGTPPAASQQSSPSNNSTRPSNGLVKQELKASAQLEDIFLCKANWGLGRARALLRTEKLTVGKERDIDGGWEIKAAPGATVLGMPANAFVFAGGDESDYGIVSATLDLPQDAVIKKLSALKLKFKKEGQRSSSLFSPTKYGNITVSKDGKVTHFGCERGTF